MYRFWENFWQGLLAIVAIGFIVLFAKLFTADHTIRYYYLSNYEGQLKIMKDIDWQDDGPIELDRSITMDSAIVLVNKLNAGIKK
jgi:hypothetical protein